MSHRECFRPGCTDPTEALDYCRRHYQKLRTAGHLTSGLTDPTPVRARITQQLNRGRTLHNLADAAHLDPRAVRNIHTGTVTNTRISTAERILAVPLPPTDIGTIRRLQALTRLGYPRAHIATAANIKLCTLKNASYRNFFHARVRTAIATAYNQLSGTPGPSTVATRYGKHHNHYPPLAWEGVDIDDPNATPNLGENKQLTVADRLAEVRHLTALGESETRACARVGWKLDTLRDHTGHKQRRRSLGGEAA